MPNRFLKDSICTSPTIDRLSAEAEVLWYRLLVQCDDFGRYDARPCVIRARCFPLRLDRISDHDVSGWLYELADAGLLWLYTADDHDCLQVSKWSKHQQKRAIKSKFPDPLEDTPACNQVIASDSKCEHMSSYPNPNPNPNSNANQLHGESETKIASRVEDNEEPTSSGAIAPDALDSRRNAAGNGNGMTPKRERKPRKPTERSEIENAMMAEFLRATGYTMPQRIQDVNWWYSELREIAPMVDNDVGLAVALIGNAVREMQHTWVNNEPLRIGDPKSIIKVARSLAAKKAQGVQL